MGYRTAAERVADRSVVGVLTLTQSLFFASLGLCVVINHSVTASNDGISFYGVYPGTILIAVVGYASASIGLFNASIWLRAAGAPVAASASARTVALGLPLLLLTPYNRGTFWNWSHMLIGITMALTQAVATFALVRRRRGAVTWVVALVQLVGGLIAAASLPDWSFPWLLPGETLYELGYGVAVFLWIGELGGRDGLRERLSRASA